MSISLSGSQSVINAVKNNGQNEIDRKSPVIYEK